MDAFWMTMLALVVICVMIIGLAVWFRLTHPSHYGSDPRPTDGEIHVYTMTRQDWERLEQEHADRAARKRRRNEAECQREIEALQAAYDDAYGRGEISKVVNEWLNREKGGSE